MQFERNEKHLILITTNYIEPPSGHNYVADDYEREGEALVFHSAETVCKKMFYD